MARIGSMLSQQGQPKPLLGGLLALIGLVLLIGGVWLIAVGGSWYYGLAGLALLVSGWHIVKGRASGAWIYIATFIVTALWAFAESGLDGWALVPRLAGPFVLLVIVALCLPGLQPDDGDKARTQVLAGAAVFAVMLGIAVFAASRPKVLETVPEAQTALTYQSDTYAAGRGDWSAYGSGTGGQRYADLNQITPDTVKNLKVAWTFHTGDLPKKFGVEMTPLKVGDSLYGCTAMNTLFALDPATGKARWRYDPKVGQKYIPYTTACRSVVYYRVPTAAAGTPCAERIYEGTLDARIIAVDARTGTPCPGFGRNGQVSITEGMGNVIPSMVAITSPPVIVQGVIVTGHEVLDGQYRWAPSGVILGYDAVTGAKRFAWDVMRPDISVEPPAGQTYTPGTPNMWTSPTGDEQLGLVYLPMGNSGGDYMSSLRRPLEKTVSSSLVALDVHTGKPRWVFQTVKNDVWDYDLGSQASLVEFPSGGAMVPAIILPSKTGDIYVLDRRTGQPLTQVGNIKAPQGGVEPAERAPIQIQSLYNTLRKPPLKEKDMWGMSPIDQMICRIQFRTAVYQGYFTPPVYGKRWIQYPGYNGGSDWGSVAIDPRRGVIVANYNDMPNYNKLLTRKEADAGNIKPVGAPGAPGKEGNGEDLGPQTGLPYADVINAGWRMPFTKMLCKQPPYGGIRAIDLKTGHTLWDHAFGDARRNGPFGLPSFLPLTIGTPNNGGAAVTAGGLIFIAATTDNQFRAIDIRTGKTVWQVTLPAGGQATPMVYEQNGKEYVVIMAGGHHFMETPEGDSLIAYALP
ncbi:membrane-bound PQQ-dependent dehydrogenase, glucose/quinate/shikimate family [Asticcacaulis solisilvae]|uniref:membrane-bound PQQ-dependent dehydrogenase, glucose/quinate/shikimate family n=1 Tax=Asticcacaulis solisilvae TaxID=1217274 RepID=UPI003FD8EA4C